MRIKFLRMLILICMITALGSAEGYAYYSWRCENGQNFSIETEGGGEVSYDVQICWRCNEWTDPPHCRAHYTFYGLSCVEYNSLARTSPGGILVQSKDPYECEKYTDNLHPNFLRKIANDPAIRFKKRSLAGGEDIPFADLHRYSSNGLPIPTSNYRSDHTDGLYLGTESDIDQALDAIANQIKLKLVK